MARNGANNYTHTHKQTHTHIYTDLLTKVQELESELDLELRRGRDYAAEVRKYQKQSQDYKRTRKASDI